MKDKHTLKWLYSHTRGLGAKILFLTLMRTSLTVLGVVFALSSRYVVDAAVSKNAELLWKNAAMLLLIIALQILIRLVGQGLEVSVVAKLNMRIRSHFFSRILSRDYSKEGEYHSGDLLTRLSDDTAIVSNGIISLVPSAIAMIIGLVYALYSLMRLDIGFAVIFLFGGILLIGIISAFRGIMKKLHKRIQETEGKVRSFFQEALGSILMVKVFGIEDKISKKGNELQLDHFKAQMKRRNLSIFASSSLGFIFSLGSLYALVYSSYRLFLGTITFGTLTTIIQLVNQIQSPFAEISGIMPTYYSIIASAERITEIEELPEDLGEASALNPTKDYEKLSSISFRNVSFSYGRAQIFENANLTINKGDFAVIGGISGIGKSTLIKLLLGVISPTKGEISLELENGTVPVGKHSRPLFSYVPQGNLLLSGTIREAVSIAADNPSEESLQKAAIDSCADEFIDKLPQGLDTYIGEKGAGLSEGQIQRLAIMRALLSDAPIILLDEATSALDEGTELKLLENLRKMQNKTCVIISHKPAAFDICNKHIFIENKSLQVQEK